MPKKQPFSKEEAEDLIGGGSLLDRVGRGEAVAAKPAVGEASASGRKAAEEVEEGADQVIKVSLYLSTEEINALDAEIAKRRKKTGRSPRRTHLIREAIQAWLAQRK